ncbi:hypothetical protein BD310DRAFT_938473, partial [Dichomitus squalens]
MPAKKRKISDFSAADSRLMLDALEQFTGKLDPEDTESLEVMQLAQSLTAKISHIPHTALSSVTAQDLREMKVYALWLDFKSDGKEKACERGAVEVEDNFLTLEATKQLIKVVFGHVSRSTEAGCRILTDIILLRLATVLSNDVERMYILTEYPIRSVKLHEKRSFGGIVDYILAKYPTKSHTRILRTPMDALDDATFRKLGSVNIFEAKTFQQLENGVPQCILAMASWCRQSGGEEVMRGAATTGEHWIFFAYKRGEQASYYARTEVYQINDDLSNLDWILGVIIDWVENTGVYDPFEYFQI